LPIDNRARAPHPWVMPAEGIFEWTFVVEALSGPGDDRIDLLYERLDAAVGSHAGLTLVTATVPGVTAVDAAQVAIRVMVDSGFVVMRSHPDLVTRPEVSDRAAVSRQAVSHWLNGKRHSEPFPPPVNAAGGGVWLWSDVSSWLVRNVKDVSDGLGHPTLNDHALVDLFLSARPVPTEGGNLALLAPHLDPAMHPLTLFSGASEAPFANRPFGLSALVLMHRSPAATSVSFPAFARIYANETIGGSAEETAQAVSIETQLNVVPS
jgi:hypothetical protein